jgi:hypothetical protein
MNAIVNMIGTNALFQMYFGEVELRVEAVIQGKTYSTTCMFEA